MQPNPVSKKTRDELLQKLSNKQLVPGLTGIQKGSVSSLIIFLTKDGKVPCWVFEDNSFIYLKFQDAKLSAIPKKELT